MHMHLHGNDPVVGVIGLMVVPPLAVVTHVASLAPNNLAVLIAHTFSPHRLITPIKTLSPRVRMFRHCWGKAIPYPLVPLETLKGSNHEVMISHATDTPTSIVVASDAWISKSLDVALAALVDLQGIESQIQNKA